MHEDRGSMSVPMPSMLSSMPKGDIVGNLVFIDINKKWLSLMSTDVMAVFGEVSKLVPLWNSCKHGSHGKTL
jgi:hypothetical protein